MYEQDAEELRFRTFVAGTHNESRDRVAFAAFLDAIHSATNCAVMSSLYDTADSAHREFEQMHITMTDLLFGLLPRIALGDVMTASDGIGYAVRYGIIEARKGALDRIMRAADLESLSERGLAAEEAYQVEQLSEASAGKW